MKAKHQKQHLKPVLKMARLEAREAKKAERLSRALGIWVK